MRKMNLHNGFAVALAWPETYCKQPGAWYDPVTYKLGINKNHYYKVGHAALLLINANTHKCNYFDFGRYHTPYQYGRVRGANTDSDLLVKTKAHISVDGLSILNFHDILEELQLNKACHGEGALHASYCAINFEKALAKVHEMQQCSPIAYGPFQIGGSNCSRFVSTVIQSGKPFLKYNIALRYFVPLSPTPLSNVKALTNKKVVAKRLNNKAFFPIQPLSSKQLSSALAAPERHSNIPENAQWLSGEGAGSWFSVNVKPQGLWLTRFSPYGEIECEGLYDNKLKIKDLQQHKVTYPSNCAELSLNYDNKIITLPRI